MQNYRVYYQCFNCKYQFEKWLPKGVKPIGNGGICPNCGELDNYPDNFEIIPFTSRKEEILLERTGTWVD